MLHLAEVVMEIIAAYCITGDFAIDLAIITAWLHDTLEDTLSYNVACLLH